MSGRDEDRPEARSDGPGSAPDGSGRRDGGRGDGDHRADAHDGDEHAGDDGDAGNGAKDKAKPSKAKVIAVMAVVVAVALIVAIVWWLRSRDVESTDDAYLDTRIVRLAPKAAGQVVQLLVTDNQRVRKGQLLAVVDTSLVTAGRGRALAARAQAEAQLLQALAQVDVGADELRQAQVALRDPAAEAGRTGRDYARIAGARAELTGAVGTQELDQAATAARRARAAVGEQREQVAVKAASLGSVRRQIAAARAQIAAADAQVREADVQIGYGRIVSPVDGTIANRTAAAGNYVQAGQELMSVVPDDVWVVANFKETQLRHMRRGQRVRIEVDAYPDVEFEGHVDSIQRGAGQSFALLPPQNATGNFVKIVQRVPVKIVIDRPRNARPLGPGMSVTPRVDVGG